VNQVLRDLGCGDKRTLLVLNKVDRVRTARSWTCSSKHHRRAVAVSGATGQGWTSWCGRDAGAQRRLCRRRNRHGRRQRQSVCRTWRPTPKSIGRRTRTTASSSAAILPRHLLHHIQGPARVAVRFLASGSPAVVPPARRFRRPARRRVAHMSAGGRRHSSFADERAAEQPVALGSVRCVDDPAPGVVEAADHPGRAIRRSTVGAAVELLVGPRPPRPPRWLT